MRNLLVASFAFVTVVSASADTIKFVDGRKPVDGVTVINETTDKVDYRRKGVPQPQSYAAELVADVEYSEPPEEFLAAMDAYGVGDAKAAAGLFIVAAGEVESKKGFAAKCKFMAGEAYRVGGMAGDAVAAYDDLIKNQPESRYVPLARLNRGLTFARKGDEKNARDAFDTLLKDAAKFGERFKHESELQLAILDESKDPAGALAKYNAIAAATEKTYPSVASQARLRIGRAMIATGDTAKAAQFFQNIVDERAASSAEIVAGAYNGLGRALYEQKNYKDALFCFLRVYTVFNDQAAEQPEAMYFAAKCFQQVEGPESKTRAQSLLQRVVREYPDSSWALEAKKG
jgi:TolA-binding protein